MEINSVSVKVHKIKNDNIMGREIENDSKQEELKSPSNPHSLATAFVGTVAQYIFVHPIWSMKISAQSIEPDHKPIRWTLRDLPTLYRGVSLHIARALPVSMVQVGVGNALNRGAFIQNETYRIFYSGFLGGVASAPIVTITDTVMTQQKLYGGTSLHSSRMILNQKGPLALFTGLSMTAVRNGGRTASYFALFPKTQEWLEHVAGRYTSSSVQQTVYSNLGATFIAGVFSTIVTNPPDVIKTIQQNTILKDANSKETLSVRSAIRYIYNAKGGAGFFSGMGHRLASRSIEAFVMGQALQYVPRILEKYSAQLPSSH